MAIKPEGDSGIAKSLRDVGPYLGLGLQLAVTIVAFVLIGSWLDKKFYENYIFTLIAGVFGIGIFALPFVFLKVAYSFFKKEQIFTDAVIEKEKVLINEIENYFGVPLSKVVFYKP
jgi:hypothetical protein